MVEELESWSRKPQQHGEHCGNSIKKTWIIRPYDQAKPLLGEITQKNRKVSEKSQIATSTAASNMKRVMDKHNGVHRFIPEYDCQYSKGKHSCHVLLCGWMNTSICHRWNKSQKKKKIQSSQIPKDKNGEHMCKMMQTINSAIFFIKLGPCVCVSVCVCMMSYADFSYTRTLHCNCE